MIDRSRPAPQRAMPCGRVLAALLLSLLVFFGLGELVARSFDLVDRLNGFPRGLYVASDDEDLPYRLRPNVDEVARGVRVVTNELGMRGPPVSPEPAPGAHRVLLLGDSVAFGFRLEREDTVGVRLEAELETRTGHPFEVLNAGVEGYNTENQLALLERIGLALRPQTVVVVFNLNDYDVGPVMGPMGILTLDRSQRVSSWSLANLSEFYLLLRWLWALGGNALSAAPPAAPKADSEPPFDAFDRYVSALRKQFYRKPDPERWNPLVAALRGMARHAREHGFRLLIAIVPDGDQIGTPEPDSTPQNKLLEVCAAEGLECLDLQQNFRAAASREPLFLDIMHPNAAGHEIMAQAIAGRLLGAEADPGAPPLAGGAQEETAPGSGSRRNAVTPSR